MAIKYEIHYLPNAGGNDETRRFAHIFEEPPMDDKFIMSGKMLFVYSLTYPDTYKPALPRLFKLIDDCKVLGAN